MRGDSSSRPGRVTTNQDINRFPLPAGHVRIIACKDVGDIGFPSGTALRRCGELPPLQASESQGMPMGGIVVMATNPSRMVSGWLASKGAPCVLAGLAPKSATEEHCLVLHAFGACRGLCHTDQTAAAYWVGRGMDSGRRMLVRRGIVALKDRADCQPLLPAMSPVFRRGGRPGWAVPQSAGSPVFSCPSGRRSVGNAPIFLPQGTFLCHRTSALISPARS